MNSSQQEPHNLEQHAEDIHYRGAVGQPAGIYWLMGRSTIAGHGSVAERRLLEEGAVLVATLLFERDRLDGVYSGRGLARIPATDAVDAYMTAGAN